MAREHILEVDGYFYTQDERLFEGVMFQVPITEQDDGWLTIGEIYNRPEDAGYLKRFNMKEPREQVLRRVESDLGHLVDAARAQGKTMTDLLDEWVRDTDDTYDRIDLLKEV